MTPDEHAALASLYDDELDHYTGAATMDDDRDSWRRSWREMIDEERDSHGDTSPTIACTLTDEQLDVRFDIGASLVNFGGVPFTMWTRDRVYFPVHFDGDEWVASVARHPDGQPTRHVGGG